MRAHARESSVENTGSGISLVIDILCSRSGRSREIPCDYVLRGAQQGVHNKLRFGREAIGRNDPDYQKKIIKFNELVANCVIYSNTCDITAAANALAGDGHPINTDDLATVSPYISHTIRRFGDWVVDLSPPKAVPVITPDLVSGALFPGDITLGAAVPTTTAPRRARLHATSKKGF